SFSSKPTVVGLWIVGLVYEVLVFLAVCWNILDRPHAIADPDMTRMFLLNGAVYLVLLLRIVETIIALIFPLSSLFVIVFFIWTATWKSHHQSTHYQLIRASQLAKRRDWFIFRAHRRYN
ncbi:hypothetical protein R3P38DRAFT_2527245, partial [Favolaschia claudopus]